MSKHIGVGIIGTGFARRVQIPAFLACEGVRVASVASHSIVNAESTAAECGATHFTSDWRETVVHPDVDLVVITTPPVMHREMTLAAIEARKHILCEKPMAMNSGEAAEMTAAAANSGRLALIDHELRFLPGRLAAFEKLRAGEIGTVRHARAVFQAPNRGDRHLPWNWWSDAAAGGGALGAIGSHIIDSFHWLLDTDIASVFCQLHSQITERTAADGSVRPVTSDDQANMILRFRDSELTRDATGLVSLSMTEGPHYRHRIELFGTRGTMRIDHRGELSLAGSGSGDWTPVDVDLGTNVDGVADTGFSRAFMSFAPVIVGAIRDGRDTIDGAATFADGERIQRVLDAARESDTSGKVIEI